MYIQVGIKGQKFSMVAEKSVLVEVPDLGMDEYWNKKLKSFLVKSNLKKGLSKIDSEYQANEDIKSMRQMMRLRQGQ